MKSSSKSVGLYPIEPLQGAMLELIAQSKFITVSDMHDRLISEYGFAFSKQYIYKIVSKMLKHNMIQKAKGKVSLCKEWIECVQMFLERTGQSTGREPVVRRAHQTLQLNEGEMMKFPCKSFEEMTDIWDILSLDLIQEKQECHQYLSHGYWTLGRINNFAEFNRVGPRMTAKQYTIIGSDSFLDRYTMGIYKQLMDPTVKIITDSPFSQRGYNMEIIGDYIFEVTLPERIFRHFEFFYRSIDRLDQFDHQLFLDVSHFQEPMTLHVHRSEVDAARLKKIILECLGS